MRKMKRDREIAVAKSRAFCRTCTLHGVHYFSEKQHWTVYVIWSAILLASITLCTFLCNMIWVKFSTDPTFTVVESTHYSTSNVPFPAVTVCDPCLVYGPNTHNITYILNRRGFNETQIEGFYASFFNIQKPDYDPPVYMSKMHKILNDLGFTMNMMLDMLAKPCEVLLKTCLWRHYIHNCSDMFRKVFTLAGYCCKFDMKYFKSNADISTNFQAGIELTEALNFIVNGTEVSFNGATNDGYVHVYVYDDTTALSLTSPPIVITPTGFFDVRVLLWVIESSDDVHTLSLASRKCVINSELDTMGGTHTNQNDCITKLILQKAASFCRCLPFKFKDHKLQVDDYPACTWDRFICIYRKISEVQSNIKDVLTESQCYQRCAYAQYNTQVDYMKNVRRTLVLSESLSALAVHYSSDTCLKYQREVLYAWDQMLANIGGIFGLCLGGSIISILELLWFVADLIYTLISNARSRKITPKNKPSIFTLSEKGFTKNYNNFVKPPKKVGKLKFVH